MLLPENFARTVQLPFGSLTLPRPSTMRTERNATQWPPALRWRLALP